MLVLGIDTAGPVVGAALWGSDVQVGWSARAERGADALLLPAIAELLARPEAYGLSLVAVSVGPGTFTGLRVGVAAALGVAVARGLPVVPIGSLEARAALVDGARVWAALDARKARVYAGLFSVVGGQPCPLGPEVDALPAAALPEAPFVAIGEGAVVYADAVRAAGGTLAPEPATCPALAVARLGAARAATAVDAGEIALRYLRAPDAVPPAGIP